MVSVTYKAESPYKTLEIIKTKYNVEFVITKYQDTDHKTIANVENLSVKNEDFEQLVQEMWRGL